ncbi:hypothetical protein [Plastoroseomonas hellenica]|uniref:Uncharacterized protein n=1 Tax=Plastoroseomonas hellenica TaxID=2687306 RepID=A0ABS5F0K8_9PROT|nr:hypothetical protein [Plastoroseomonas hellenica]MBR0645621.1 hypothetical protein [Plastoroseomonas hellenica]MBR0666089.1 hypothetical protein [Plastoroseomonas hellenica]
MGPADLRLLERYAAEVTVPPRCADRGVCAAFTTPALFGTRLRPAGKGEVELLIPNPSGRAGWLVVPWAAVMDAFSPTIADRMLVAGLGAEEILPETMTAAALRVAGAGLAGRAALRAAQAYVTGMRSLDAFTTAQLEQRARGAGELLPLFRDCGIGGGGAPLARRAGRLLEFAQMLSHWRQTCPFDEDRNRAALLAARAVAVAEAASALIAAMHALAADLPAILAVWRTNGIALLAFAQRAGWVLDGWELIACLWRAAAGDAQLQALRRIYALAPPAAAEALAWPGCAALGGIPEPRTPQNALRTIDTRLCEAALCDWLHAP